LSFFWLLLPLPMTFFLSKKVCRSQMLRVL
jgi:hypothetical protein